MTKKQNCTYQLIKTLFREHGIDEKLSHTMQTISCATRIETKLRQTYPKGILIAETPNCSKSRITHLDGELYEYIIQKLLKWILRDNMFIIKRGAPFSGCDSFAFDNPNFVVREIIPTYIKHYQN